MRASISIGFAALRSANDSAIASATSASMRPVDFALSNLRPPAGSRVTTALAAHNSGPDVPHDVISSGRPVARRYRPLGSYLYNLGYAARAGRGSRWHQAHASDR